MKAARYTQNVGVDFVNIDVPEIADDEILLRISAASICGTDVKIVNNGHRKLRDGQTITLGHEFVGYIEQIGSQVSGYTTGQRVGIAPNAGCGHCRACIAGKSNYCPDYTAFGIDRDGAHTEYVVVRSQFIQQGNIIDLPATLDDETASLLEPFSCVVNGINASQIRDGDIVVIYGAGPIGLMHLMMSRVAGAGQVIVVDPLADRQKRAKELGADIAVDNDHAGVMKTVMDISKGDGADVVITACPVAAVQEQGIELLATFGRICLFGGLPKDSGPIRLDSNAVHYKNQTITGTTGGSVDDYREAMELAAMGKIDLRSVVSDRMALMDIDTAYDIATNSPGGKVILIAD
jgi:L-iditol 2-dehydrogenase